MIPATRPTSLWKIAKSLENNGGVGFLLSGGCDLSGRVPLDRFLGVISKIKKETHLRVNAHPGLVDSRTAQRLSEAEVDVVSPDIVGSTSTIRRVYNLSKRREDFEKSIQCMVDAGLKVSPHICIGLDFGRLKGERRALRFLRKIEPNALVLTVLLPRKGTPMERTYVDEREVSEFMREAKDFFPSIPLMLGCMRPRGYKLLERQAVDLGFSGIVLPSRETIEYLGKQNKKLDMCCALIE